MAGQEKPKAPEQEKWYFTKEQLQNSASRRCGLDADKELAYRQQAANLIQDMGQRLQVSQLCINTAIVYMHRFYAFHSFTQFHRNAIAAAALFLAAKVEEQPRKLEYVIKVAHVCLHRGEGVGALTSDQYQEQAQDLVFNENVLLQTLGFDVAIDHPHTHVVRTCHLVKAPKDLAQTSYFMASNSLHLTTMCLQYRPTVVACFCIHLASKWSNWAIPQSSEGRHWFSYVDKSVTSELLERLTAEFLHIFDKCPSRLKRKMMTMSNNSPGPHSSQAGSSSMSSPFDKKHSISSMPGAEDFDKSFDREYEREKRRPTAPGGYAPAASAAPAAAAAAAPAPPAPQKIDYNVYREKREREERERRQQLLLQQSRPGAPPRPPPHRAAPPPHHKPPWPHHHKPPDKPHAKPPDKEHRHHRPPAPPPPAFDAPQRTRPPSLFSPESTTPATAAPAARRPPPRPEPRARPAADPAPSPSPKKRPDAPPAAREPPPAGSPPPRDRPRPRPPSASEPELVPVVRKLDEAAPPEPAPRARRPEPRRADPPRANGIETDPTLVSNLLKESLARPAPITVQPAASPERDPPPPPRADPPPPPPAAAASVAATTAAAAAAAAAADEPELRHKKEKKKKEKHKHKDRDKSKDERRKHKKERGERKKEAAAAAGVAGAGDDGTLRITIPRDKLEASPGLKIKIPKERLAQPPLPPHSSGLKIKISKEVLETSRKRPGAGPDAAGPPLKVPRQNGAPKVDHSLGNGHAM